MILHVSLEWVQYVYSGPLLSSMFPGSFTWQSFSQSESSCTWHMCTHPYTWAPSHSMCHPPCTTACSHPQAHILHRNQMWPAHCSEAMSWHAHLHDMASAVHRTWWCHKLGCAWSNFQFQNMWPWNHEPWAEMKTMVLGGFCVHFLMFQRPDQKYPHRATVLKWGWSWKIMEAQTCPWRKLHSPLLMHKDWIFFHGVFGPKRWSWVHLSTGKQHDISAWKRWCPPLGKLMSWKPGSHQKLMWLL